MSPENGAVYVMRPAGDEEWVSPTPVRTAITDAVTEETDLEGDDVDDIDEYVDIQSLRGVLDGDDDELAFTVEDHEVTVTEDGDIRVD